jgi:predicted nucleic acid-binding protein
MICTLDANALISWIHPSSDDLTIARLDLLFDTIAKSRGKLIVPTPCLAEAFVHTQDETSQWVEIMARKSAFVIAPFDAKAALECAFIDRLAISQGNKRTGTVKTEQWQKIKVDRQIAAIAKVHQSDLLVTNDQNLRTVCKFVGIKTSLVDELLIPEGALQHKLELNPKG